MHQHIQYFLQNNIAQKTIFFLILGGCDLKAAPWCVKAGFPPRERSSQLCREAGGIPQGCIFSPMESPQKKGEAQGG